MWGYRPPPYHLYSLVTPTVVRTLSSHVTTDPPFNVFQNVDTPSQTTKRSYFLQKKTTTTKKGSEPQVTVDYSSPVYTTIYKILRVLLRDLVLINRVLQLSQLQLFESGPSSEMKGDVPKKLFVQDIRLVPHQGLVFRPTILEIREREGFSRDPTIPSLSRSLGKCIVVRNRQVPTPVFTNENFRQLFYRLCVYGPLSCVVR